MPDTKRPFTSTFVGTVMLVFLLLALISCGTNAPSGDSVTETKREVTTLTTLPEEKTEITSSNTEVFFPQQRAMVDYMLSLIDGRLILDDEGCIRLKESDGDPSPTLLWPASFDLRVDGDEISIFDQRDRLVGRIGEKVELGGGGGSREIIEQNELGDDQMVSELFERCPGHYWLVAP